MKKLILAISFLFALNMTKASDTLTVRQVYNFSIGDTFDYADHYSNYDFSYYYINYSRVVITQKALNATQDTLTYNGNWVITNLDDIALFSIDTLRPPGWTTSASFFDITTYPALNSNFIQSALSTYDGIYKYRVTDGLGVTYTDAEQIANNANAGNLYNTDYKELIYYSKGTQHWGTPYYIANQQSLVHYMPLPESCAVWSMRSYGPPPDYDTLYEQIRTGSITDTFNFRYVQMLYSSYDKYTQYTIVDSTIGYFINDNADREVLFADSLSMYPPRILYNFKLINGSSLGYDYVTLYQDTVGGIIRTHWRENTLLGPYHDPFYIYQNYAEGIGSLRGLKSVQTPYGIPIYDSYLTSLCVCGQTIYPDTSTGICPLLTGIPLVNTPSPQIHLYPNPVTAQLQLTFAGGGPYKSSLIISNMLGQEVYTSPITQTETTHDISKLTPGIYTWRIISDNATIKTGKIIKQ